ncbi:hypothetical protein, partial [Actinomadura roseirufa]|uniref:hypothetical protein n=1 Tax=Actinomadura roseirufa TaxID=2094049 RepID=UPI0010419EDB
MGHGSRQDGCADGAAPFGSLAGCAATAGLGDALLARVTAADVQELLRDLPQAFTRALLTPVGLRDTRKITAATGEALLRALRHGDPQRRLALRDALAGGALYEFGNPDGLAAADCAALLVPATAPDVLARAHRLRGVLAAPCPMRVVAWCLARVVEEDRPLAVVALGLLAERGAELGEAAGGVEAAWTAVRERHPALPARPIGLAELRDMARRPPGATGEGAPTMPAGSTPAGSTPAPADPPLDLAGLEGALGDLAARLPDAAAAAGRVAARLAAAGRPDEDDLAAVRAAVERLDELRARAERLVPGAGGADVPALAAAVRAALDAERRSERVRALRGLQGPDAPADLLREVREAAAAGDDTEALGALAELIEVMGVPGQTLRGAELAARARELLPEAWRLLADLALMGRLSIVPVEDGPADDGPGAEDDDDGGPGGDEPPAPDTGPEARDTDADLADLDAMLAETFPVASAPEPVGARPSPLSETVPAEASAPPPAAEAPRPAEPAESPAAQAGDEGEGQGDAEPPEKQTGHEETGREETGPAERGRAEAPPALPPEVVRAEVAALRAGRFGLAGRLRTAAGRPEAEERARRCAALAREMVAFAGPLSAEFVEAARDLGAKALANDPAGGLLAWAASIRAGLVHPTPESTRLLEELTVVVSQYPDLKECGEAFARAARSGAYLGPGLAGRIRGSAEAAMVRRKAVTEAGRMLLEAPHQKIRYQLATEVWKSLVQPDGPVGRLLVAAERDDAGEVDAVLAGVTVLRAGDAINRMIDERTSRITAGRKNRKIIARARAQLVKKVEAALDTVAEWAGAARDAGAGPSGDGQDWRLGPFGQLQEAVGERRAALDAAFGALAGVPDPGLAAAATAAREL